MRMAHAQTLLLLAIIITACSAASDGPTNTESVATPKDGFQEDPLSIATFGGNVFAQNERFAAYSFVASRVSVISPAKEKEIWGRHVDGKFNAVFPLPGVSAVGLVSNSEFRVVGPNEQLKFPMNIHLDRWRWARDARVAIFNDFSNEFGVIVRNMPNGEWKTINAEYPNELKFNGSPAPLITNDGLTVVELFLASPAYMIYRAEDASSAMEKAKVCEIDVEKLEDELDFKKVYSGGTDGNWLLITFDTKVVAVDISPGAACVDPKIIKSTEVVAEGPLRRVLFTDERQAIVASESGEVATVSIADDGSVSVNEDFGKPCALPVGLNQLSDRLLALACVTEFDDDGKVENVALLIYDISTKKTLHKIEVELEKLAGVAVDPVGKTLFEFLDGGLGELRITELSSGRSHSVRGLFTHGILDNL